MDRTQEIVTALEGDTRFNFKARNQSYLQEGNCPNCGKKELWVSKTSPWVVRCSRLNKCGYEEHVRDIYPELFNNFVERFPKTPDNPNATADAYLSENRQFPIVKIKGWYTQELYQLPKSNKVVPTVRFYIDKDKTRYWERLIDVTKAESKQRNNIAGKRKSFPPTHADYMEYHNTLFKGEWWSPPGQKLEKNDVVLVVEGIFHAIALWLCGFKVVAIFSAGNFPEISLRAHKGKNIQWVIALDDDPAGRKFIVKHIEKLRDMDEFCGAALTGSELDWDDLYRLDRINDKFIAECRYRGRLFLAKDISEKAWEWHKHTRSSYRIMEFDNVLYSIEVSKELHVDLERNELTINDDGAEHLFSRHVTINEVANITPTFLYAQIAQYSGEISYDFQIRFSNGSPKTQISLPGSAIESNTSFNKALLNKAAGATFSGTSRDYKYLSKQWFGKRLRIVETLQFIGYSKEHDAWIFNDVAYQKGRRIDVNEHNYFPLDNKFVRSGNQSVQLEIGDSFSDAWLPNFYKVFGANGMIVLTYWIGSLFAEQIRKMHKSWPFLEMSGEPGTGKTTILELLWRTVGRSEYEGFDPSKATFAARARAMMQVANLPVVFIEADREDDGNKRNQFDYNELKTAYNGRSIRSLGVMNRGSETEEPPFRGSIIFAQNEAVQASRAILERIIRVHFTKANFTDETDFLASQLGTLSTEELSGLVHQVLSKEKDILSTIQSQYSKAQQELKADSRMRDRRLVHCHAQLLAVSKALPIIFNTFTEEMHLDLVETIVQCAVDRHKVLEADNQTVARFWEVFELLNEPNYVSGEGALYEERRLNEQRLNHSAVDGQVAINLQHFYQVCAANRMELTPTNELKKVLITSKRYQFVANNQPTHSKILGKTIRCWVFKEP